MNLETFSERISPEWLAELVDLVAEGVINRGQAKDVLFIGLNWPELVALFGDNVWPALRVICGDGKQE